MRHDDTKMMQVKADEDGKAPFVVGEKVTMMPCAMMPCAMPCASTRQTVTITVTITVTVTSPLQVLIMRKCGSWADGYYDALR